MLTRTSRWTKARTTNATNATFTAPVPTGTTPPGDSTSATAVVAWEAGGEGGIAPNGLAIMPYAVGSDNNTFAMRVYAWRRLGDDALSYIWTPQLLVGVACTISSSIPGVTGRVVIATEFFADTITLAATEGNANISCELVSPADNANAGHVMCDIKGCQRFSIHFSTGSSATSMNALWAFL